MRQGRATPYSWMYGCSNAPKVWRFVINRYSDVLTCSLQSHLSVLNFSCFQIPFHHLTGLRESGMSVWTRTWRKMKDWNSSRFMHPFDCNIHPSSEFCWVERNQCAYISRPLTPALSLIAHGYMRPLFDERQVWRRKTKGPKKDIQKKRRIMMWSIFWL